MASVIQSAGDFDGAGSATSLVPSFSAPTGPGRTLLAIVNVYNGPSVSGITDDQGNTGWAPETSLRSSGDANLEFELWKCENATAGVEAVTIALSGGSYVGAAISVSGAVASLNGGSTTVTLANWKLTPYFHDAVSPAGSSSDPLFVSAGSNFRLQVGSYALTQGRVTNGIGGTNGDTIPAGCYVTGGEDIGLEV